MYRIAFKMSLRQIGFRPRRALLGNNRCTTCHCPSVKSLGYCPLIAMAPSSLTCETKRNGVVAIFIHPGNLKTRSKLVEPNSRLNLAAGVVAVLVAVGGSALIWRRRAR